MNNLFTICNTQIEYHKLSYILQHLARHSHNPTKNWCPVSNLRSIVTFESKVNFIEMFDQLKLLRFLCLFDIQNLQRLSEEFMKSMIQLRCLQLTRYWSIRSQPLTLYKSYKTLVMINTDITQIPETVVNIQTLRFLVLDGYMFSSLRLLITGLDASHWNKIIDSINKIESLLLVHRSE